VEETYFTINLSLKEDTREKVRLKWVESDAYIKCDNVSGRDVYVMKNTIDSGNSVVPETGVYSENGTVITPSIPKNYNNDIEEPHIKAFYAKADEFYKISMPNSYAGTTPPEKSGVYLASFTYTGDEIYQAEEYICYIIISE